MSNGVECSLSDQRLTEYHSIMAQVFVVVAAGSVIGFIIRDLGDGAIAGWIIQVDQHRLLPSRLS